MVVKEKKFPISDLEWIFSSEPSRIQLYNCQRYHAWLEITLHNVHEDGGQSRQEENRQGVGQA
jgi:hypothetical protein